MLKIEKTHLSQFSLIFISTMMRPKKNLQQTFCFLNLWLSKALYRCQKSIVKFCHFLWAFINYSFIGYNDKVSFESFFNRYVSTSRYGNLEIRKKIRSINESKQTLKIHTSNSECAIKVYKGSNWRSWCQFLYFLKRVCFYFGC